MRFLWLSLSLSFRDWLHEWQLSLCGILSLASMLTPLLVLHGVHTGVIDRLRENLLRDPAVLVLVPVGGKGAGFTKEFLASIKERPECSFSIGRTRNVASELQINQKLTITLEATEAGDPMLEHHKLIAPHSDPNRLELILSASAAARLAVKTGDTVTSSIGRRLSSGKFQRKTLSFTVISILPPGATANLTGFTDMEVLTAIQDFRDGISSPFLQTEGDLEPATTRYFESFRAYARSLDHVESFEAWFTQQDVAVKTRSRDIANIKSIDATLNSVIALIAATGLIGFFAFMLSNAQASVRRKWKMMGMLKLLGFQRFSLLLYPITQALLSGTSGCFLSFTLYTAVAYAIDLLFAAKTAGEAICIIPLSFFCLSFLCIQGVVILASLPMANKASRIDPSTVIREL